MPEIQGHTTNRQPLINVAIKKANSISIETCVALVDTGATSCIITQRLTRRLTLLPAGRKPVQGINAQSMEEYYLVELGFTNITGAQVPFFLDNIFPIFSDGRADDPNRHYTFDLILGMDVIECGRLHINGPKGQFTFSF